MLLRQSRGGLYIQEKKWVPSVITNAQSVRAESRNTVDRPAKSANGGMMWLVPELDTRLPQILDEVREHFRAEWPDYADFLSH